MNRDDIIRMAWEVKGASRSSVADGSLWLLSESHLEAFAKLIEQHLSYDGIHTCHAECQRPACVAVREAVKAEREACAKLCEKREAYSMPIPCPDGIPGCLVAHYAPGSRLKDGVECAAAIRARGEK